MLVPEPGGLIHAFWLNEDNQLFHSFVQSDRFGDPASWFGAIQLAESAVGFDAVFDEQGKLHVAYVRILDTLEFPAGIYYRTSNDIGLSWTLGQLIYQSPYFRSLTQDQANVDLEATSGTGDTYLHIVWDNRSRKQVSYIRSTSAGSSWEQPQIVDSPTDDNVTAKPAFIQLAGHNDDLLRLWVDGDPSSTCTQYYQFSTDEGNSWSDPQVMLAEISGCAQDHNYFRKGDLTVMMTTLQGQVYLLAWDGSQWSLPQVQQSLTNFQDPETYSPVSLGCRVPRQDSAGNLLVVGCDTGGGADIWLTSRSLGDALDWFPLPSEWSSPEEVTRSQNPITSPLMLADSESRLHVFWLQQETVSSNSNNRSSIYYSVNTDDTWSRPVAILSSPIGFTRDPSIVIDRNDNIYVVWSGGESGEIYFSRATASDASTPTNWSQPILLPSPVLAGSSPDIDIADNGHLYVAYSIPLNEQRGIYITISEDKGTSWLEPILAFDARQAGWEMIDFPKIVVMNNETINLTYCKLSFPGGRGLLGLYSNYSTDRGVVWSELNVVSEKPTPWSDLVNQVRGGLFRTWMESNSSGGYIFQHQISQDLGLTWGPSTSISTIGTVTAQPSLSNSNAGLLYLNQAILDASKGAIILTWQWDGESWNLEDDLLIDNNYTIVNAISSSISSNGSLALLYSTSIGADGTIPEIYSVNFSDHSVELPLNIPADSPSPTAQPTSTQEPEINISPTNTPMTVVPTLLIGEQEQAPLSTNNIWTGLIFGSILAGLLAIVVFLLRLLDIKRK